MCWCFGDQADEHAWAVLDAIRAGEALTPAVFPLELGNALVVAERKKKLRRTDSERFLQLVLTLPIRFEQEIPKRQWGEILALARQFDLSTYDPSHLDLAMRSGSPLATKDQPLRAAAKRSGVRLF